MKFSVRSSSATTFFFFGVQLVLLFLDPVIDSLSVKKYTSTPYYTVAWAFSPSTIDIHVVHFRSKMFHAKTPSGRIHNSILRASTSSSSCCWFSSNGLDNSISGSIFANSTKKSKGLSSSPSSLYSSSYSSSNHDSNDDVQKILPDSFQIVPLIKTAICTMVLIIITMLSYPDFSFASEMDIEKKILERSIINTYTVKEETSSKNNNNNNNNNKQEVGGIKNDRSRYWALVNSDDKQEVMAANEKLMDYAVGTINTMYYDNSGGAYFSPKDMYDRWKILRVYAREGIQGVEDLVNYSDVKKVTPSSLSKSKRMSEQSDQVDGSRDKFNPQLFLVEGNTVKVQMNRVGQQKPSIEGKDPISIIPPNAFDSRDDVVRSLKWLVSTLDDPYSKYLTREELKQELEVQDDGFLGLGAIVEGPNNKMISKYVNSHNTVSSTKANQSQKEERKSKKSSAIVSSRSNNSFLTLKQVSDLPSFTAIAPKSPAERAGIVVGDYIVSVGNDNFLGLTNDDVQRKLSVYLGAENYFGYPELTIAKPIYRASLEDMDSEDNNEKVQSTESSRRDEVLGYKMSRVRLTTISLQANASRKSNSESALIPDLVPSASAASPSISGGDSLVQWELLQPNDSIFRKYTTSNSAENDNDKFRSTDRVGYIRLTRFSRLSTAGYVNAVEELEKAGAQSYIIDVRNNYGGVIQESMLTASTLLRDPHTVLCYTLNSRGGFTPHDAEEYIVDTRYPGYLLSSESRDVTMEQVKRDSPNFVTGEGWIPPSSYASIREQRMNRGISRTSTNLFRENFKLLQKPSEEIRQLRAQKKIVILMNEGTASAAEVFVSSLHDNGRTVATVGTKTYGKGLIQHTFPMQDGGGLRLSVAEYLTPALQHVTKVGNAQYDPTTGEYVGGGVKPDVFCPSTSGIASNVGADICVGMALDALEDADAREMEVASMSDSKEDNSQSIVGRRGGIDGGSGKRRNLTQGIVKDDF